MNVGITSERINIGKIESAKIYVEQFPFVDDDGIYIPLEQYVPEGCASNYKCIMTKEMFVAAYNKWIKNA